jgi:hypothetical protein
MIKVYREKKLVQAFTGWEGLVLIHSNSTNFSAGHLLIEIGMTPSSYSRVAISIGSTMSWGTWIRTGAPRAI